MTFGFDSSWPFSRSVMGIADFANDLLSRLQDARRSSTERKRPILFICHSLGGIVVKRAIILAHEDSDTYHDLQDAVKGVVFMGTPHRGSQIATFAQIAANILNSLMPGNTIKRPLMRALSTNSRELEEINRSFVPRCSSLELASFYEAEIFPGLPTPVGRNMALSLRLCH